MTSTDPDSSVSVPGITVTGLARRAPTGPLWLAFSGGLDSTALLHLLVRAGLGPRLSVVHVDHGLHPDSGRWAAHCEQAVRALDLPFFQECVDVTGRAGLEANARAARYRALCRLAGDGTLITAHHRDDQAETLLLRLLRGAGASGLASISEHSRRGATRLWRPLLGVPREALRELAEQGGWSWIEDPSNRALHLDRNYLRAEILPRLRLRWPGADAALARAAGHQADAAALLAERAEEDGRRLAVSARRLPLAAWQRLDPPRLRNLLRWWLAAAGAATPSAAVLAEILALPSAAADRSVRVAWGGWQLRRFQDHLHLLADAELAPLETARDWPVGAAPPALGAWRLVAGPGDGTADQPALQVPDGLPLRLAPARGGERLALNGCHQRVAELWRAAGVPPWRRRQWPLAYAGDQLIAVPGVAAADPWRDQPLTTWHLEPAS
jgi:tRNA(Ile)-lysidine synthase